MAVITAEGFSSTVGAGATGGVLHRDCPYDARSARDMHRTTRHGDEVIR